MSQSAEEMHQLLANLSTAGPLHADERWSPLRPMYVAAVVFVLAGAVGNVLVCVSVCVERSLHCVTNYFLVSLAVADLLVSCVVMPFGLVAGLLDRWPLGAVWCNVYVTCDVLACTSSIWHMGFVSLGRYMGIRHPLRQLTTARMRNVLTRVACVWLLSLAISSYVTVLGVVNTANIMPNSRVCAINNRTFFVVGSLLAFFVPMTIMVVTYVLTTLLLRQKCRSNAASHHRHAGGTGVHQAGAVARFQRAALTVPLAAAAAGSSGSGRWRLYRLQQQQQQSREADSLPVDAASPTDAPRACSQINSAYKPASSSSLQLAPLASRSSRRSQFSLASGNPSNGRLSGCIIGRRRKQPTQRSTNTTTTSALNAEKKASTVLGLVFLAFVVCWLPFFSVNIAHGIFGNLAISHHAEALFLWLGYSSSTINPIIYTVVNKTFRRTFVHLLTCRCPPTRRPQLSLAAVTATGGGGAGGGLRRELTVMSTPLNQLHDTAITADAHSIVRQLPCKRLAELEPSTSIGAPMQKSQTPPPRRGWWHLQSSATRCRSLPTSPSAVSNTWRQPGPVLLKCRHKKTIERVQKPATLVRVSCE